MSNDLRDLAQQVGLALKNKNLTIVTAESCTGGLLSATITEIPGSSEYFERGFVVYSNQAKQELLQVKNATLEKYGAVSAETAEEMAKGALKNSSAQISIAITGIAGPDGGTTDKPIGTVCFGFALPNHLTKTFVTKFSGDRDAVRTQATIFALKKLLEFL